MKKINLLKEILLWIAALLLALVCLRSGLMKMPGIPGSEFWMRDFARWGYPDWFRVVVGVLELGAFALLLVPRFAGLGAAVFAVVMIGAIATHISHGEFVRLPFNFFLLVLSLLLTFARRPGFLRNRLAEQN